MCAEQRDCRTGIPPRLSHGTGPADDRPSKPTGALGPESGYGVSCHRTRREAARTHRGRPDGVRGQFRQTGTDRRHTPVPPERGEGREHLQRRRNRAHDGAAHDRPRRKRLSGCRGAEVVRDGRARRRRGDRPGDRRHRRRGLPAAGPVSRSSVHLTGVPRDCHRHAGPPRVGVAHHDTPVRALDDPVDQPETEPAAVVQVVGGDPGLQHVAVHLRHSGSVVGDCHRHLLADRDLRLDCGCVPVTVFECVPDELLECLADLGDSRDHRPTRTI